MSSQSSWSLIGESDRLGDLDGDETSTPGVTDKDDDETADDELDADDEEEDEDKGTDDGEDDDVDDDIDAVGADADADAEADEDGATSDDGLNALSSSSKVLVVLLREESAG